MNNINLKSIFGNNCKIKKIYLDVFFNNPFSLILRNDIVNPVIICDNENLIVKSIKSGKTTYISNILLSEIISCKIIEERNYIELVLELNKIIYRMLVVK